MRRLELATVADPTLLKNGVAETARSMIADKACNTRWQGRASTRR
jgi:hypothetical protein